MHLKKVASVAVAYAELEEYACISDRPKARSEALDHLAKGSAALLQRWAKPVVAWAPMSTSVGHSSGTLVGGPMTEAATALTE